MSKLKRLMPPGADLRAMKHLALIYMSCYAAVSTITFILDMIEEVRNLYDPITGGLLNDAHMADFHTLWRHEFYRMYWIYTLLILGYVGNNYSYFRKSSKSIYTMARIRSPWELHVRCWALPLFTAGAMVAVHLLLRTLFFVIYVLVTPAGVPKPGFDQLIGGLL